MDKQVADAIADLGKRTSYLESIHPDITYTKEGLVHNIASNLPLILFTAALSAVVVVLIVNHSKK